jgi:hypothetical protein
MTTSNWNCFGVDKKSWIIYDKFHKASDAKKVYYGFIQLGCCDPTPTNALVVDEIVLGLLGWTQTI